VGLEWGSNYLMMYAALALLSVLQLVHVMYVRDCMQCTAFMQTLRTFQIRSEYALQRPLWRNTTQTAETRMRATSTHRLALCPFAPAPPLVCNGLLRRPQVSTDCHQRVRPTLQSPGYFTPESFSTCLLQSATDHAARYCENFRLKRALGVRFKQEDENVFGCVFLIF
jgi:hypothetical protein